MTTVEEKSVQPAQDDDTGNQFLPPCLVANTKADLQPTYYGDGKMH